MEVPLTNIMLNLGLIKLVTLDRWPTYGGGDPESLHCNMLLFVKNPYIINSSTIITITIIQTSLINTIIKTAAMSDAYSGDERMLTVLITTSIVMVTMTRMLY